MCDSQRQKERGSGKNWIGTCRWSSTYGVQCDKVEVRRCLPSDSSNSGREISSELAGSTPLATESDKWLRLVRATINDQHEGPTLVMVIAVIWLGGVRIIWIYAQVHHFNVLDGYPGTSNWVIATMDVLRVVLHVRIPLLWCSWGERVDIRHRGIGILYMHRQMQSFAHHRRPGAEVHFLQIIMTEFANWTLNGFLHITRMMTDGSETVKGWTDLDRPCSCLVQRLVFAPRVLSQVSVSSLRT